MEDPVYSRPWAKLEVLTNRFPAPEEVQESPPIPNTHMELGDNIISMWWEHNRK